MAKTTNSISQSCAKIEIDIGCTGSYTDISGETNTATLPEEVVTTGSMPVFDSTTHVTSTGSKEPITAGFSIVYTEDAAEAFDLLRAAWLNAGDCEQNLCVRVTPAGGTVGDKEIYVGDSDDPARFSGFTPPDLDAGSGDPTSGAFSVFGNYYWDTKAS